LTFSPFTPETIHTSPLAFDVNAAKPIDRARPDQSTEPGTYGRGITTEPGALAQNGQRPV
jgi:hypothetical protein